MSKKKIEAEEEQDEEEDDVEAFENAS